MNSDSTGLNTPRYCTGPSDEPAAPPAMSVPTPCQRRVVGPGVERLEHLLADVM
jgi:hypothetical protein